MPFIWLRARKYKCEKLIKMLGESPRDVKMEDTMLWANFNSYRDYVSLDAACKLFGLPGKGEMDGSQVFKYWQAGKNEEIGMYGAGDVGRTYNLTASIMMGTMNQAILDGQPDTSKIQIKEGEMKAKPGIPACTRGGEGSDR
jgi:predicted PolB exonuclease-like 3'-5' exonuclease